MTSTGLRSFLILFTACAVTGACGSPDIRTKKTTVRSGSKYSYEYTEGSCTTGRQTFYSLDEYCKALNDDEFNNSCAANMRREAYQDNCKG